MEDRTEGYNQNVFLGYLSKKVLVAPLAMQILESSEVSYGG